MLNAQIRPQNLKTKAEMRWNHTEVFPSLPGNQVRNLMPKHSYLPEKGFNLSAHPQETESVRRWTI